MKQNFSLEMNYSFKIFRLIIFSPAIFLILCFTDMNNPSCNKKRLPTPDVNSKIENGVNLVPSYYNDGAVDFAWDLMKQQSKIKTVRIEIEPDKTIQARSWIKQAFDNGYSVIATYHKCKVLGSDDVEELYAAANWWKENYDSLKLSGLFTINLMNEWGSHQQTPETFADAYNKAIATVRSVYKGKIIIDCPGWGQGAAIVAYAIKGSNGIKISDTAIICSCHIYPSAWNAIQKRWFQKSDLDVLISTGRPCMIGEFGNSPVSGGADWLGIVEYAKSKGLPVLGWCWNGDGETMNMLTPKWLSYPTAKIFTKSEYFNIIYNLL